MIEQAEKPQLLHDIHFEHQLWTTQLKFYEEELNIYKNHLEKVSRKYSDGDTMRSIEHFHNSFIRQNEVINDLKYKFRANERYIVQLEHDGIERPTELLKGEHLRAQDEMNQFIKLYRELKQEFARFSASHFVVDRVIWLLNGPAFIGHAKEMLLR